SRGAFNAVGAIDPRQDPLLEQYASEAGARLVTGDPVLRWVAPYDGVIDVDATVRKLRPGGSDGVSVGLYRQDDLLTGVTFGPSSGNEETLRPIGGMRVTAGESFYVVVSTGADDGVLPDGSLADEVAARVVLGYTSLCFESS